MALLIGTSGWHYAHWRRGFYPPGLAASQWLDFYARRFATVELNNAFYRLPEATTFAGWRRALPEGFVVAVKVSRYLTHVRRLREPAEPVERLMSRAGELGPALGPLLLQLPPNLRIDLPALDETLRRFPGDARVAVECRHQSWFVPELREVLARHGAALCLTATGRAHSPLWRTTDWGYVRFHRGTARPEGCFGPTALATWAGRLADLWPADADVFAYFNNDGAGCAPRDARRFAAAAGRAGLEPTRVPGPRETPVAGPGPAGS